MAVSANPLREADLFLHLPQRFVGEIPGFFGIVFDNVDISFGITV